MENGLVRDARAFPEKGDEPHRQDVEGIEEASVFVVSQFDVEPIVIGVAVALSAGELQVIGRDAGRYQLI